ncbi:hypothetical protein CASFOL_015506 [Castilleja foliolosa]|uniref:Exopolygalacturonase-like n=1 Tax=Castilleja foliolosa TaxID=1961234 RepID=A0ABD3DE93_9LAMI
MASNWVISVCATLVLFMCSENVNGKTNIFRVTNYDPVSNGFTDFNKVLLSKWRKACDTDGGELEIPPGNFMLSGVIFQGPCNGKTYFRHMGTLKATPGAHNQDYWITFQDIDGLIIIGNGTFDGNGPSAWSLGSRPSSIRIVKVKNVEVIGVSSLNSKMFHFHIVLCENVIVDNVNILAPGDSPNTDGIHVARCSNVSITNTHIATGDDCISMGDGIRNIHIEKVVCGPGHGISIGSLGRYTDEQDVIGVTVKNCTLINTTNGLRIKTLAPSSVSRTVSDVTYENINVVDVQNPIIIDQFYCPSATCKSSINSNIKINGVKYINIKGTSASPVALNLQCSKRRPCQNLEFHGIGITTGGGRSAAAICSSVQPQFVGYTNPSNCGHALRQNNWLY